ncbi:MAG: Fe-S cluster assembly ATPase SufC [bacterium]|nr:Fe-S cluster assembly ATPase SufC [bacterium]
MFTVKQLVAEIDGKEILHGVDISMKPGEVHVVMGPNGSGKTSLVMSLMGHPDYTLRNQNSVFGIDGRQMLGLLPEERARAGLFVSFQNPVEITGVSLLAFLRTAEKAIRPEEKKPLSDFKNEVKKALAAVGLDESFLHRSINEGFSGGERKRAEVAQLIVLSPKYAILDEVDSGLDVDSLKLVAHAIRDIAKEKNMGILLITHYQRILDYLEPDRVHILVDGTIKKVGGIELVSKIETEGYATV